MKFEHTRVYNFEHAFRGMRNPMNSWDKSDSYFGLIDVAIDDIDFEIAQKWNKKDFPEYPEEWSNDAALGEESWDRWLIENGILTMDYEKEIAEAAFIGPVDMNLAQRLIKSGPEHRKFMRQLFVTVDITAPLYWWKEFDTYKVGTVANSTSTMHKIASKPITIDCFEIDDYNPEVLTSSEEIDYLIQFLEGLRLKYLETKDKRYWKELIRWLPESWLQTRTVTLNYENLLAICSKGQRRHHKLTEWSISFIEWARSLPYAQQLIFIDEQADSEVTLS